MLTEIGEITPLACVVNCECGKSFFGGINSRPTLVTHAFIGIFHLNLISVKPQALSPVLLKC
ncbi:hypothetical protein [Bacillus luti]|uniref:hypothetical protein n=1 Tax=Bacillus luti TaxID=2026191 RepID=UPI001CEF69FE|nr:hypothetical protein [Bacillus luti]